MSKRSDGAVMVILGHRANNKLIIQVYRSRSDYKAVATVLLGPREAVDLASQLLSYAFEMQVHLPRSKKGKKGAAEWKAGKGLCVPCVRTKQ